MRSIIFIIINLFTIYTISAQCEKIVSSCIPYEFEGEAWDVYKNDVMPAISVSRICVTPQDYEVLMSDTTSISTKRNVEGKYSPDTYYLLRDNKGKRLNQYDLFYIDLCNRKYYFSFGDSKYSIVYSDSDKSNCLISLNEVSELSKSFGKATIEIVAYKNDKILETWLTESDSIPSDIMSKMEKMEADRLKIIVKNSRIEMSMTFQFKYYTTYIRE